MRQNKLGLEGLPDAVASAQYHYLSNSIGGVEVEYMYESDRKAWVHFCHPRWVFNGTALCGTPQEACLGYLKGWYAQNGVSLKNSRLGFVCTSQDTTLQYGMAGYFKEFNFDLEPEQRLQFAPSETAPPFVPEEAPRLDPADWSAERLQKANRNFGMDFVKDSLRELANVLGPGQAAFLGNMAGQQIGQQFFRQVQELLAHSGDTSLDFVNFMAAMVEAQDDTPEVSADGDAAVVRQYGWRVMRGSGALHPAIFEAWNGLWQGCLSVHNRFLVLEVLKRMDYGDDCFEWRVRPRGTASF